MPMVSVIVPVYNAEQYLCQCIESVLKQTYRDFELLLIDDCSSDGSFSIMQNYQFVDSRVKAYQHASNMGVSKTRNDGINVSCGKYIVFIDSDDYVSPSFLEILVKEATALDSGLAMISHISGRERDANIAFYESEISDEYDDKTYLINQHLYHPFAWGCLFDAEIIKSNKISFAENAKFTEDIYFVAKYLCFVNKVRVNRSRAYFYWLHAGGELLIDLIRTIQKEMFCIELPLFVPIWMQLISHSKRLRKRLNILQSDMCIWQPISC